MTKLDVMESGEKEQTLENPGGRKVMADMGGEHSGLPFYAFLDEKGNKIVDSNAMPKNQNIGYPGTAEEITVFEGLLKKSAPKMKAADRDKIIAFLNEVSKKLPH